MIKKLRRAEKPFFFHQLNSNIRKIMKDELEWDLKYNKYYKSPRLTPDGLRQYPNLLERAIKSGNDISFSNNLRPYFRTTVFYTKKGRQYERKIPNDAYLVLGQGQFNIYYIRAICQFALSQGIKDVEVYRGRQSRNPRKSSQMLIGERVDAKELLNELRNLNEFGSKKFQIGYPNSGLSVKV